MLIRLIRTTIVPTWFITFGVLALLWSPMTLSTGILLLIGGVMAPAVVLVLMILVLERQPTPAVAKIRRHASRTRTS